MVEFEPWMIRTALVVATLFLLDGALYVLNVRFRRRHEARSQRVIEFPRRVIEFPSNEKNMIRRRSQLSSVS